MRKIFLFVYFRYNFVLLSADMLAKTLFVLRKDMNPSQCFGVSTRWVEFWEGGSVTGIAHHAEKNRIGPCVNMLLLQFLMFLLMHINFTFDLVRFRPNVHFC